MSPTLSGSQDGGGASAPMVFEQQFIVVASEKQCRVMTLPSQTCIFKQQITDTDYVIKAEIINLKGEWGWDYKDGLGINSSVEAEYRYRGRSCLHPTLL